METIVAAFVAAASTIPSARKLDTVLVPRPLMTLLRRVRSRPLKCTAVWFGPLIVVVRTESEIVDGVYTGRLAAPFCYGEGKAEVVRKLVADRGYDLAQSYAYADSASDLPIMSLVGHPVAVNPDRSLEAVAHRRGWPVVEFVEFWKTTLWAIAPGAASTPITRAANEFRRM